MKVLSLFGAAVVLLGWIYSGKNESLNPLAVPVICVALVVISCGVIPQGISTYGIVLGYIQYKNEWLNEEFGRLLQISDHPFKAVERWRSGSARYPVLMSSACLLLLHLGVSVVLLYVAAQSPQITWAVIVAALLVAVTLACQIALSVAVWRVFRYNKKTEPA